MHIKTALLLIFTTCSLTTAYTQDYALSIKGDTLRGKLKPLSYDNIDRLQIISAEKKTTYTAVQIRSFVKSEVKYEPVKYENSLRFMRVLKPGYLTLYAFNPTGQNGWDGRYFYKKDGQGLEVPNLAFKKLVAKYLRDCKSVQDQIENGELSRKNLEQIVDTYNTCMQNLTNEMFPSSDASKQNTFSNEKLAAINKFSEKVEAENFLTKKDVVDLLKDLQNKVTNNQTIPNYLTEGLRSYLVDTPALSKEADELIVLLKK